MIDPVGINLDISAIGNANQEQEENRANPDASLTSKSGQKAVQQAKSLIGLAVGEVFSAEILDIQPGLVTLKIGNNKLGAKTLISPDARIGDKAVFLVKNNTPGQIVLEFMRGQSGSVVSESIVKEALLAANMQYTPENSGLIEQLVMHNLPIDHSNLQRAAFFQYSLGDAPFSHTAFLLENNFAPKEHTIKIFKAITEGTLTLQSELENLKSLGIELKTKLAVDLKSQNNQDANFGRFLTELREAVQAQKLSEHNNPNIRQSLDNINDLIDFSRNINETKYFYHFPFVIDDRKNTADIHVFKRKGAKKADPSSTTALISLNMAHLGHVDIVVSKSNKDVMLQFRANKDITLANINNNSFKLAEMLSDKGFLLKSVGLKKVNEQFDITTNKQTAQKNSQQEQKSEPQVGMKRYSFDMRV